MNKAIITVVGQDTVGIIARVCTYLSQHNVNVLDISQTIIDGYFNMMMIVDYANADKDFGAMVGNLEDLGDDIGVRIRCQREEIFQDAPYLRRPAQQAASREEVESPVGFPLTEPSLSL